MAVNTTVTRAMANKNPKSQAFTSAVRCFTWATFVFLAMPAVLHAQIASPTSQQVQQATKGLQTAQMPDTHSSPTVAPEGVSTMKLVPGSMVDIHVFEESDLDGTYRLDGHGNISLPLAGSIHLESLTLRQAEVAIGAKLVSEEILKTSHVVVNIDEYGAQNIVVLGEVNSPGRYPALAPRKLVDVLAMAGGRTQIAGNEIVIHRAEEPPQVTELVHYGRDVDSRAVSNVEINPGDTVQVKKAGIVYVLGSVNRPGGYVMQEAGDLNIIQALAMAFGTAPEAANGSIRIIRKQPDGSILELPAQYNKVNKGQVTALPLQAEDIVFVPSNKVKSVLLKGQGVFSAATSATIYTVR
jgi:polysaccharide export outer membrane protein